MLDDPVSCICGKLRLRLGLKLSFGVQGREVPPTKNFLIGRNDANQFFQGHVVTMCMNLSESILCASDDLRKKK